MVFTMDMAHTPTHIPVNLSGASWAVGSLRASFEAKQPGFGVQVVATGEFLSTDGVAPSVWGSKSVAAIIAEYPHTDVTVAVER